MLRPLRKQNMSTCMNMTVLKMHFHHLQKEQRITSGPHGVTSSPEQRVFTNSDFYSPQTSETLNNCHQALGVLFNVTIQHKKSFYFQSGHAPLAPRVFSKLNSVSGNIVFTLDFAPSCFQSILVLLLILLS